jgi:uncharacterized protein YpmB
MVFLGGQSVNAYLKSDTPPKHSVLLITMFLLLVVIGGAFGFLWADKELKSSEAEKSTATIIQSEIAQARSRLNASVESLYLARGKSLEQSVYGGNLQSTQEMHRTRAKEISEMIEIQEERYAKELQSITAAFSSIIPDTDTGKKSTK